MYGNGLDLNKQAVGNLFARPSNFLVSSSIDSNNGCAYIIKEILSVWL